MTSHKKRSRFAQALLSVLDDTNLFSRQEWARVLRVSEPAISQWVNDKTIPRADVLQMIIDVVSSKSGVPQAPIRMLVDVCSLPSVDVTPFGERLGPTLQAYMSAATVAGLGQALRDLPNRERSLALKGGSWLSPPSASPADEQARVPAFGHAAFEEEAIDPSACPFLSPYGARETERRQFLTWDTLIGEKASVVTGGAGSGKTAILKALHEKNVRDREVNSIWIGRDTWSAPPRTAEAIRNIHQNPGQPSHLVVDALDECSDAQRRDMARRLAQMETSPNVRITVASRMVPDLEELSSFKHYAVAPLNGLQAYNFLMHEQRRTGPGLPSSRRDFDRFLCHFAEKRSLIDTIGSPIILRCLWRAFVRNNLTLFWEADSIERAVRYIIEEWDADRRTDVPRESWASGRMLLRAIGELCVRLIDEGKTEFNDAQLQTWLGNKLGGLPIVEFASLLEEQGWIMHEDGKRKIARDYFRDYFAAFHIVESTASASHYISSWPSKPEWRNVLRIACGLAADAGDLIASINSNKRMDEVERGLLLAEVLAQPIAADASIIQQSCDIVVAALEHKLKGWSLVEVSEYGPPAEQWYLAARANSSKHEDDRILRCFSAVHRARSGRARAPLQSGMRSASSPILRAVGSAMEVEGRMKAAFHADAKGTRINASIGSPEFA